MALNVKLLRKVQKHILAEPNRYDQNATLKYGIPGERYHDNEFPACGTIGCIGGWVAVLTYKRKPPSPLLNFHRLRKELGIDENQMLRLFAYSWTKEEDSGWPDKFRKAYLAAQTTQARAKIAAARIDHFIATKGAE